MRVRSAQVQGDYLRGALNVDINNVMALQRRKRAVLFQAMTGAHSLFLTSDTAGFLVRASALYAITLPTYTETLLKTLSSDDAMSYVAQGDDVFYSNGTDSGRIMGGAVYPLGLPTPDAPTLKTIGGNLLAGNYLVSIGYSNTTTGEEGGLSDRTRLMLSETGGVRVTLPAATTGATHVNVYLSGANGEVPQWAASVAAGTASVDLIDLATGREAPLRREEPLPAGSLFWSSGRLCSFHGSALYLGLPYKAGYYDPLAGYLPFPDTVSVAIDAQAGIFVAADKTYWIPADGMVSDVLPYGAVPGTAFSLPDRSMYGWFGRKGIVLASPSGEVDAVMSDSIALTAPTSGISTVFEEDEYRKVVSCGWCMNLTNKAVTQYSGWGFTSFSRGYGTMGDGIYTLATGGEVGWSVDFGKTNLGAPTLKHLPSAYLGVESDEPLQLRVQAPGPNSGDYTYLARSCDEELQMQRIDVGKGLRSTWFELELTSENGTDFKLASVDFVPAISKRRI